MRYVKRQVIIDNFSEPFKLPFTMSAELPTIAGVLPAGTTIHGYVIEGLLGRGGMGNVYLATQTSLARKVALKILHPNRMRNPTSVESFLREARAAAQLNHPNLVAIYDIFFEEERQLYCYSMEYVQGQTGTQFIRANGVMKRAQALPIIFRIAKALGHAHRQNFVHRDVKPDNILIGDTGIVKLLDLGLVHDRVTQTPESGSRILSLLGTPDYSAPEQLRNPKQAVPASDIYSLGATLYFLLAGKPPINGETIIDLIVRVATDPVHYSAAIPEDCRILLELMLAKRPSERPIDGEALAEVLKEMSAGRAPELPRSGSGDGKTTEINMAGIDNEDDNRENQRRQPVVSAKTSENTSLSARRRLIRRRLR
jgi:eukaryotic-like serine/threonine-protein kinase